jgi:hypothetical protein
MIKNSNWYSFKISVFSSGYNKTRIFRQIFEKYSISNNSKIRPVGVELFHAGGRTEDDAIFKASKNSVL